VPLPDAPAWTESQQLAGEKEALGFYMSGHPLERFARDLTLFGARRVAELTGSEADIWMAGIVSGLRPLKTRKGDRMACHARRRVPASKSSFKRSANTATSSTRTRCCSFAASRERR
jgi:DNA polymerase-3 subunit alpha